MSFDAPYAQTKSRAHVVKTLINVSSMMSGAQANFNERGY